MNFKPFFVHEFRRQKSPLDKRHPRGFCALVAPNGKEDHINVRIAFCAGCDNYDKKKGREWASHQEAQSIRARDLAEFLDVYAGDVWGYDGMQSFFEHKRTVKSVSPYEYLYRYMI